MVVLLPPGDNILEHGGVYPGILASNQQYFFEQQISNILVMDSDGKC